MEPLPAEALVEQLAALAPTERRRVIQEAEARALAAPLRRSEKPIVPWTELRSAIGIMHGAPADALEDCDRLYDG